MSLTAKPAAAELFHQNFIRGANYTPGNKKYFSVSEPSENLLRVAMLESGWLMKNITLSDVITERGDSISLGDNSLHTGRAMEGRFSKNTKIEGTPYLLEETDTCASISYEQMSLIANSGRGDQEHFTNVMSDFFGKAVSLDMLRIGFNGEFAGFPTQPDVYTKGQDVNKGWHTIAKEFNDGSQVITDEFTLGDSGDFPHLDALANYLIMNKIPEEFREDPRLVVLVGSELASITRTRLFNGADRSSDIAASQTLLSSVAGRFALVPPFMPGRRLAVTTLDNLHIYTQKNTRRFRAEFIDDRSVYEHSYWRNEGYGLGNAFLYAAADEASIKLSENTYRS